MTAGNEPGGLVKIGISRVVFFMIEVVVRLETVVLLSLTVVIDDVVVILVVLFTVDVVVDVIVGVVVDVNLTVVCCSLIRASWLVPPEINL